MSHRVEPPGAMVRGGNSDAVLASEDDPWRRSTTAGGGSTSALTDTGPAVGLVAVTATGTSPSGGTRIGDGATDTDTA